MSDPSLFDQPADIPVTPYAGTSGHSGSGASHDRAVRADRSGLTGERDRHTLSELSKRGPDGVTWGELCDAQGLHHGEATGALSRLHQVGEIARLTERRGKSSIYVLPCFVDGRSTAEFKPNVSRKRVVDLLDDIDRKLSVNDTLGARRLIREARSLYDG